MATFPISIDSAGGEYMESVLIVSWAKRPGDAVTAGDLLVTVETAKAATEIEAERDGYLAAIHFTEGQEAPVGAVLGTLSDTEPLPAGAAVPTTAEPTPGGEPDAAQLPAPAAVAASAASFPHRPIASPLARRLAKAADLDLGALSGSGPTAASSSATSPRHSPHARRPRRSVSTRRRMPPPARSAHRPWQRRRARWIRSCCCTASAPIAACGDRSFRFCRLRAM